jgi:hypothetical protein
MIPYAITPKTRFVATERLAEAARIFCMRDALFEKAQNANAGRRPEPPQIV